MANTQTNLEGGAKPLNWGNIKFDTAVSGNYIVDKEPNIKFNPTQTITDGGMCLNSEGKKVGCNSLITNAPAPPTKSGDAFFPKLAGAYNQNLIIALVLVAGYFAYKKFKK